MNAIIVHGSFGNPFENWFSWLAKELIHMNIPCIVPSFPTPDHQNYQDWEQLMDYYSSKGLINEDTILIGHSCGAIFLIHYILTKHIKVRGIICVSGYNNFISGVQMMDDLNGSFYITDDQINVSELADHVYAYYGDDDPFIPQDILEAFAARIGGEKHCIHSAGHFNENAGYTTCEVILGAISECMKEYRA